MKFLLIVATILIVALIVYALIQKFKNIKLGKDNKDLEEDNSILSATIDDQKERNISLINIFKASNEEDHSLKEYTNEIDKIELALLSDNYAKQLHKLPKRKSNPRD